MIAAHIEEHGVTQCPAACATETTATLSPADLAAHKAHGFDHLGEVWRQMSSRDRFRLGVQRYWGRRKEQQR